MLHLGQGKPSRAVISSNAPSLQIVTEKIAGKWGEDLSKQRAGCCLGGRQDGLNDKWGESPRIVEFIVNGL